jgi:predicted dehydrogenase
MPNFADIPYLPKEPQRYRPNIGLIGCGGISKHHLSAYQKAGYAVTALCDVAIERARERQQQFYPEAAIYSDYHALLARDDIAVVDITTHPAVRVEIIEAALRAGKHVLSQKPFVLELAVGERLVALAEAQGVLLAVNQNGRFAPHFSYLRGLVAAGALGELSSLEFSLQFDHNWTADIPAFNSLQHLILYDYAIHWFDLICALLPGQQAQQVYAAVRRSSSQRASPPLVAHAALSFADCLVTLAINGDTLQGGWDRSKLVGSRATAISEGPSLNVQQVTVLTPPGSFRPQLTGAWFDDGFHGAMAELLCAIEEGRPPVHNARDNLRSLALCFAVLESADSGQPVKPRQA